ncbi:MAG: rod shape-determining protein MreD [Bacteroidia bacterium]
MLNEIIRNGLRFFLLILVQGLILKYVEPGPYINPFLYLLFLLLLPFDLPAWLGMLLALITGLCIDWFYNTLGMHMAVCTFIGWVRPALLRFIAPRDGYENSKQPTIQDMGFSWFITYAALLVVMHHLLLFYLEMFSFREFFHTLFRVFCSSLATLLLIVVTQFLFNRQRENT